MNSRCSGQPFRSHLTALDTSVDPRAPAQAVPTTPSAMAAAVHTLHVDLTHLQRAVANPSPKAYRLALSHLLSSLELRHAALLTEQHAPHHSHGTLHLYTHMVAWHYVALHPHLLEQHWALPDRATRIHALTTSIAGRLGTLAPRAVTVDTPARPATAAATAKRMRVSTYLRRARITAPEQYALQQALSFPVAMHLSDDETTAFSPHTETQPTITWSLPPLTDAEHHVRVTIAGSTLVAITSSGTLSHLALPDLKASRFLPRQLHWRTRKPQPPWWRQREGSPPPWFRSALLRDANPHSSGDVVAVRPMPTFHASSVIARARQWKRRLGRFMGQAASIILDGKLCLPLDCNEVPPMDKPNLPTCFESPEATAFVDSIVAEYMVTNVVSWYPPGCPPLCLCPIGTVSKKTDPFFRLIIDARGPNAVTSRWASNMRSLASATHIFQPGSVCFTLDIGKAYICSPYQGCRQATTRRMRADGQPYLHIGCTPEDCTLTCSKVLLGFRWRQQLFAFNAPMFGGKISGNILDTVLDPVDRWVRARKVPFLRWVDDGIYSVPPLPEHRHDTTHCGGSGACWMCDITMRRACKLQDEILGLLTDLGFTFNEKRTPPAQRGEFIGLGWDTLRCTLRITAGKALKMSTLADSMAVNTGTSRRELAQLRGRLIWFSPCLYSVRLLTRALNAFIGSPANDLEWDTRVLLPDSVLEELRHWSETLATPGDHERPMWKLRPAQLHEAYLQGSSLVQAYLETDASLNGWGCTLRLLHNGLWEQQTTSVAWAGDGPTIQVQCEAEALAQALALFAPQLQGRSVLHVTDCAPTLALPVKGSAASARLQSTALRVWRMCSRLGIHLSSAWVPGDHMIASGTDTLSREALDDPHSARLEPDAWLLIQSLARRTGLSLDVDWFADHHNNQLPRFWSRNPTPGSEGTDALSAPSWGAARCPQCGTTTPTHSFLFPPVPLIDKVVAKAQQDGATGIIVFPRLVASVWWPILAAAAISPFSRLDPAHVNTARRSCSPAYATYHWNYAAFDFSPLPRREKSQPCQCHAGTDILLHPSSVMMHQERLQALLARSLLADEDDPEQEISDRTLPSPSSLSRP
jgi:hypothetical protein